MKTSKFTIALALILCFFFRLDAGIGLGLLIALIILVVIDFLEERYQRKVIENLIDKAEFVELNIKEDEENTPDSVRRSESTEKTSNGTRV